MRLRDSFWALLGHDISDTREFVVERIRSGMLKALDAHCHDSLYDWLDSRISAAREALDKITLLFKGHHPSAKPSRFGSL